MLDFMHISSFYQRLRCSIMWIIFPVRTYACTSIMLFNCTLIRSPSVRVLPTNSVLFKCADSSSLRGESRRRRGVCITHYVQQWIFFLSTFNIHNNNNNNHYNSAQVYKTYACMRTSTTLRQQDFLKKKKSLCSVFAVLDSAAVVSIEIQLNSAEVVCCVLRIASILNTCLYEFRVEGRIEFCIKKPSDY